jgi:hypothetical protein
VIPYKVLCTYKPSRWRASVVGRELTAITQEFGLQPHIDKSHGPLHLTGRNWVSFPLHAEVRRRTFRTNQAESFHYDADLDPNGDPNCAIVLWASNSPTEIKWKNWPAEDACNPAASKIWRPDPYQVVIFNNMHCLHRRPQGVPRIRWIFRQRCSAESAAHLKLP